MKRTTWLLTLLILLAFPVHAAQRDNSSNDKSSKKKITISGLVGSEGKTLVSDKDNRVWTVSNPNALSLIEGRRVTVKAYADANSSELKVAVVRLRTERTTPKLDDAAFRR
ncbi:MAG TPA: hypothetical protein VNB49_05870 [Candidatus Dormibacteraeota bacterium]|nr:hypothetical protein [Candidatus Dormibacteraeota bacterium]